jgi:hypothetical protein
VTNEDKDKENKEEKQKGRPICLKLKQEIFGHTSPRNTSNFEDQYLFT